MEDCFTAMLAEWLQSSPNPTWSELVKALRSPVIDHDYPDIAEEIEDKYTSRVKTPQCRKARTQQAQVG